VAKQRLERSHRCAPAIETKDELVQVGLEVVAGNAVVGALEPGLEVADHAVGARDDLANVLAVESAGTETLQLMVVAQPR
jgi:hypothetical protein